MTELPRAPVKNPFFITPWASRWYRWRVNRTRTADAIAEIQAALQAPKRLISRMNNLACFELENEHGHWYAVVNYQPGPWPAVIGVWRDDRDLPSVFGPNTEAPPIQEVAP